MRKEILARYSCRRRQDFVTFLAVAMFLLIVSFECYLMFWLPIQFRRENAMARHVARQNITQMADSLRGLCRPNHPRNKKKNLNSLQESELLLVLSSLDILAIYIRENQEKLSDSQAAELQALLNRTNTIVQGWQKLDRFNIKRDKFDPEPVLRTFEKRLDELDKRNPVP